MRMLPKNHREPFTQFVFPSFPPSLTAVPRSAGDQACSVGSNIWLSDWTEDYEAFNDTHKRNVYLGVYGALGFGQGA